MSASLDDVYSALQQADAAGDTSSAQQLADYIRSQPAAGAPAAAPQQPSGMDGFLRQTALTGRAAAQGVVSTLTLPDTVSTWELNKLSGLSNRLFGTNFDENSPNLSQQFSQAMTDAGAYTPQGAGEQMASALTQGTAGALAGGGVVGLSGAANAARLAASGAVSSGTSETARQAGLPSWAQFGAGLIGGQIPALAESSAQTIGHLVAPLTESGQARMAGAVLNEQASNPQGAIVALQGAKPIVPGSLPTMGPASGDLGLLGMQKGLRNSNPVPFAERISSQNAAQQNELSDLAGTPSDLSAAIKARSSLVGPLYAAAATDSAPIDNEMIALMQRPSMQAAITKAQSLAAEKGQPFGLSSNSPGSPMSLSGQDLQGIKMALDDMKTTAFTQGIGSHQANAMQDTIDSLRDWMQRNVPSQRAADAAFQSASAPINRMESLQDLQKNAGTSAVDLNSRVPFLSSARFSSALDKLQGDPRSGVTPNDMTRLLAVQRDSAGAAGGQWAVIEGGRLRHLPELLDQSKHVGRAGGVGRFAMKPLDFLYQKVDVDKSVNEMLTNAALYPSQKQAGLMQKAAIPPNQFDMYRLGNAYDVGTFFGLGGRSQ